MSQESGSFRVVFLVDTSPRKDGAAEEERVSNALNLSALKILSHFAHKNGQTKDNILWGYKFFNSSNEKAPRDRFNFREFDSKLFEAFETEVSGRLEPPWSGKENEEDERSRRATNFFSSSETFRTALSEITYEFNWDMPDISSPCKPVRPATSRIGLRGKSGARTPQLNTIMSTVSRNYVFVLSPCPKTSEDLVEFVGSTRKNGLSTEDVRSAILPPHVYRQMSETCRIRLYWVDVQSFMKSHTNNQQVADKMGVNLVAQVLEGLNGCVIPGNALLQLGSHVTSSIQSLLPISKKSRSTGKDGAAVDVPDFPLTSSSLLEYYTARSWERQGMDIKTPAVLCHGADRRALCSLELQPMFSPQNRMPAAHSILSHGPNKTDHSVQRLSIEWTGSSPSQLLTCSATVDLGQGASQGQRTFQDQRSNVRGQSTGCRTDLLLMVRGTVERGCLLLTCFHPTHAYTCVMSKERLRTSAETEGCSVMLEDLLLVLSREGLSLVVDFHDPSEHLPITGVLQPLTAASATLTVVRSDMLLTLEKVLAFPKVSSESSNTEHVDTFVKRCVSHFLKKKEQQEAKDHLVLDTAVSSSSSALFKASSARFRLQTLEPWYKTAPNSGTSTSFIQKLSSIPEDVTDEGIQEPELLEVLHKLYTNQLIGGTKPQEKGKDISCKKDQPPDPSSLVSRRSKRLLARIPSFSDSLSARAKQIVGLSYKKHEEQKTKPKEEETAETQLDKEKQRIMEERKEVMRNVTIPTDFTDEDSLISQLKENYNQWLEEDKPLLQFVQSSVQVALHYVKSQGTDDPEKYTRQLLEDKFLSKAKAIRDKYQNASGQTDLQMKIREFQLQALLRVELFSALSDQQLFLNTSGDSHKGRRNSTGEDEDDTDDEDDLKLSEEEEETVEEICGLLRPISFATEPGYLASLLEEQFVNNYVHNMEKLLKGVYRELGLTLPDLLAPGLDEKHDLPNKLSVGPAASVASAVDSASSVSSQRGSRRFVRNPSLMDAGQKKAILVHVAPADKAKKSKRKRRKSGSARKKRSDPVAVKEEDVSEVKRVRRNLSMLMDGSQSPSKLSRRASMPAPSIPSPRKSPRRGSTRSVTTPRGRHILKDNTVEETPAKKQLSNALWQKQERARRRARTNSEVFVVGESPVKPLTAPGTEPLRRSPRKHVSSFRRRPSFYDPSKRSRYVVSAQRVAKKIRGCNTSPLKIDFTSPRRTPRKSPAKFLLSELLGSAGKDSPRKKTPELRRTPRKTGRSAASNEAVSALETPEKSFKTPTKRSSSGRSSTRQTSSITPTKSRGTPSARTLRTPTRGQSPFRSPSASTTLTGTSLKKQNAGINEMCLTPQKMVSSSTSSPRSKKLKHTSAVSSHEETGLHLPETVTSDLLMTPSKRVRLELLSTGSSPTKTNQPPPASATPKKGILKSPCKMFLPNTNTEIADTLRPFPNLSSSPGNVTESLNLNKSPAFSTRSKLPDTPPQAGSTTHFLASPKDAKTKTPDSISKWPRKKRPTDSSPVQSLSTPKPTTTPSPRTKTLVGRLETSSTLRRSPRSKKPSRARGRLDVGEVTETTDFLDDIEVVNRMAEDKPTCDQEETTVCGKTKVPATSPLSAKGLLALTQSPILTNMASQRKRTFSGSSKVKNLRCSIRSRSKSPASSSCSQQNQSSPSKLQLTVKSTGGWSLLKERKRKRSGGQYTDISGADVCESTRKKSRTDFSSSPDDGLRSRKNRLSLSRKKKLQKELKSKSDSQEVDMDISALSSASLNLSSADEDVFYCVDSSVGERDRTSGSAKLQSSHDKGTASLQCTPQVKKKYPSTPLSAHGLLKLTQSPLLTGRCTASPSSRTRSNSSLQSEDVIDYISPPASPEGDSAKLPLSMFGSSHRESLKERPTSPSSSAGHYLLSSSPPNKPKCSSASKTSPLSRRSSLRSGKTPTKSSVLQRSPFTCSTVSNSSRSPHKSSDSHSQGSKTSPSSLKRQRLSVKTPPQSSEAVKSPTLRKSLRNKKKAGVKRNLGQLYRADEEVSHENVRLSRKKSVQSL
ncbi:treslin-like [Branchiostoma floridae x Branchiostoma belcheri]